MKPSQIQDTQKLIQQLRQGDSERLLHQILEDIQDNEKTIDLPSKENLYNEHIHAHPKHIIHNGLKINGHPVHPIFAKINNMLHLGLSPIIAIVGKEGYGKSMAGLYLANKLHEINLLHGQFSPRNQIIYRVLPFLLLLRDSTRIAMLFEEANETLNKNRYNTKMNFSVASALRTQRKREVAYIFICPELPELDPRIKKKSDIVIELIGEQRARITSYALRHGKKTSKGWDFTFNNYPDWNIPDVAEELQNEYEQVDNQFKGTWMDELILNVLRERISTLQEQRTISL